MRVIILKNKFSNKIFGLQLKIREYVFQLAFGKFGIYNHKTNKWIL